MIDGERISHITESLRRTGLDAVVCALPAYVLMATGYWPVIGASVAVFTRDGHCVVLVPEDERALAERGWAEVRTYVPTRLDEIRSVNEALHEPLQALVRELRLVSAQVGYERGPASEPASYAAMHLFGGSMVDLLRDLVPSATLGSADEMLAELAAVKTAREVERIRIACEIAADAFAAGAVALQPGLRETEAAARFRAPLSVVNSGSVVRADGFAFCMSGANSAEAYGSFARSRQKLLARGDLTLIHCNSYADGYWTDVTRTYSLGVPSDRAHRIYEAVLSARAAALKAISPGVRACDVDRVAREELATRGFGNGFKHSTGHGVGFAAISTNARPRIHPKSREVLAPGMVFNLEPAVYVEGFGGIRHCDMVAVTATGAELLTPFHPGLDELVIPERGRPGVRAA